MINLFRVAHVVGFALFAFSAAVLADANYDVVINNGRVIDPESGLDDIRSIGIRDGKIVAIAEQSLNAEQVIEAEGYVVGPGFIDYHAHGGSLLSGRLQAFDGVTTAIEAELGQLPTKAVYQLAKQQGRATNYGWSASWAAARMQIMGGHQADGTQQALTRGLSDPSWSKKATAQQQQQIIALLRSNLRDGALGIGLTLGYASQVGHSEIRALSALAVEENVPIFVHGRFWGGDDPGGDIAATQEIISNAITSGAHWFMHHISLASVEDISTMLAAAQKAGARIDIEALVSETGSTFLGAEFLSPERLATFSRGLKPSDILYYGEPIANNDELRRLRKQDPSALIFLLHRDAENNLAHRAIQKLSFSIPGVVLGSDAMPWKNRDGSYTRGDVWPLPADAWAHPRSNATFTQFIDRWVNRWAAFSLMDVFTMGSYRSAKIFEKEIPSMRNKGRIKLGADADILVFKPLEIEVRATLKAPQAHSIGMHWVLVNGVPIIQEGTLSTQHFPGQPVLRSTSK